MQREPFSVLGSCLFSFFFNPFVEGEMVPGPGLTCAVANWSYCPPLTSVTGSANIQIQPVTHTHTRCLSALKREVESVVSMLSAVGSRCCARIGEYECWAAIFSHGLCFGVVKRDCVCHAAPNFCGTKVS